MYRVHFFLNQMMFKTTTCGLSVPTIHLLLSPYLYKPPYTFKQVRKRNANEYEN